MLPCALEQGFKGDAMNDGTKIEKKKGNPIVGLIILIVLGIALFKFLNFGIHSQVTSDFEEQYKIASRGGDKVQICVQAGLVAAAYLQAHDSENFDKWKSSERVDCAGAGLPK